MNLFAANFWGKIAEYSMLDIGLRAGNTPASPSSNYMVGCLVVTCHGMQHMASLQLKRRCWTLLEVWFCFLTTTFSIPPRIVRVLNFDRSQMRHTKFRWSICTAVETFFPSPLGSGSTNGLRRFHHKDHGTRHAASLRKKTFSTRC
jgi:hypothetical protein